MEYLLLLFGFSLLIFSGGLLIQSSVSIARRLHLSPFVIGLTVVAVGTSAPELLVSLTGALKGHADVAVYNVIGSNISNIMLVLALATMILPIPVKTRSVGIDISVMLIFSLMVWLFFLDLRFSTCEGVLILSLLVLYVLISLYRSRRESNLVTRDGLTPVIVAAGVDDSVPRRMKTWAAVLMVIAASGGLAWGANLLVDNAVIIARQFGLSERIISVSLIAVGTSIPELTTSAIAAFRKETDISIGNIIGSNIFNIGLVLGITSIISPMDVNPLILSFDIFWFVGIAILLILLIIAPPRSILARWKGLTMLSVYLIYLYLILK
ncbi:calcium/sodium antiporter [Bacteroidota bacterium]